MDNKLIVMLPSLIFIFPLMVVCAVGVFLSISRSDIGIRAKLGGIAFGLFLATQLLQVANVYLSFFAFEDLALEQRSQIMAGAGMFALGLSLTAFVLLIVAVFRRDRKQPAGPYAQ